MKLAIVGSREANETDVMEIIERYIKEMKPTLIISGGSASGKKHRARGVDAFAEKYAISNGIEFKPYPPDVQEFNPATCKLHQHQEGEIGYMQRNLMVAENCDTLLRVVSRRSRTYGSGWTRDRAQELGKPTFEEQVP